MAFASQFEVKGLKELGLVLSELPDRVAKRILRAALKKAAMPIQHDARQRARVAAGGPTYPTVFTPKGKKGGGPMGPGHMAENIIAKVSLTKKGGAVAKVGPDAPHWYLAFQEFGTPKAPADPVLSAALTSQGEKAVGILARELGNGIDREALKLAREKGAA